MTPFPDVWGGLRLVPRCGNTVVDDRSDVRAKHAILVALVAAAVIFTGIYLFTTSVVGGAVAGLAAGAGAYFLLARSATIQLGPDNYVEDADRKVEEALVMVREIKALGRGITAPVARGLLDMACTTVPDLLARVKANSPNSLYSSASQIGAHLDSLQGAVRQYIDIQNKPAFYKDPEALKATGEQAFRRFTEFVVDSVRLVNQGDIAAYRANLETVAPPKMPELT